MQKITPFLWFNDNAEEAVRFYTGLFPYSTLVSAVRYDDAGAESSGMPAGSIMTIDFELSRQRFTALNGGPAFSFTPAISFFVQCGSDELERLFAALSKGGQVLMPLDKYPFSERYAFLKDRFGVAWQLMLEKESKPITPCLLFVGESYGRADEAIHFYTSVFRNTGISHLYHYEFDESKVLHSAFLLEGQEFMAMDGQGEHAFDFNEATSFAVHCRTQEEIDRYWELLSEGGDGKAQQCGWLKDRFGVSWQIVPANLSELLRSKHSGDVMKALLQMKKIDLATLERAAQ